jgi:hypothetical protein
MRMAGNMHIIRSCAASSIPIRQLEALRFTSRSLYRLTHTAPPALTGVHLSGFTTDCPVKAGDFLVRWSTLATSAEIISRVATDHLSHPISSRRSFGWVRLAPRAGADGNPAQDLSRLPRRNPLRVPLGSCSAQSGRKHLPLASLDPHRHSLLRLGCGLVFGVAGLVGVDDAGARVVEGHAGTGDRAHQRAGRIDCDDHRIARRAA